MRIVGFIGAASVAALLTFQTGATFAEVSDLVTVTVVGSGANEAEARLDAIRQATQQVASQVVVAERLITDDEVVYDNVLSTMNGFVHDFTELSVKKSETEVQVEAEIIVSGNLMRDFATGQANSVSVDGGGMFGELLRSKSQAEVHQKMFESIWKRHTDGIEAEIALKDYDEEYVTFNLHFRWSQYFKDSIEKFFSYASNTSCNGIKTDVGWYPDLYERVTEKSCDTKEPSPEQAAKRLLKSRSDSYENGQYRTFGFYTACLQVGDIIESTPWDRMLINCYLIDNLTILPLISSRLEYDISSYDQFIYSPQEIRLLGYYGQDGKATTANNSYGPPQSIYPGVAPFALVSDVTMLSSVGTELTTFRISLPMNSLFGSNTNGLRPSAFWGEMFVFNDASFQIAIPTTSIPLQEIESIKVSVVSN